MSAQTHEGRESSRPKSGEAPFQPGEGFYSRTDERGIILSGNEVFHRVGAYPWSELLGAPHKLVRHPDMPKGVFWIFWNDLKAGQVTGAYVKNLAKDGLYYWVFAIAAPTSEGFISARIKPMSEKFQNVPRMYARALQREKQDGLSAEQSAEAILADLKDLGFNSYREFILNALGDEVHAETNALGLPPPKRVQSSQDLFLMANALAEETYELVAQFEKLFHIPRNLQILSTRLEATGGPLSVLCQNYNGISIEMQNWFARNVSGDQNMFTQITKAAGDSLLLLSAAEILHRCSEQLAAERRHLEGIDIEAEREYLNALTAEYQAKSQEAYAMVEDYARRIYDACHSMRRMLSGLDTIRIAFKIENARVAAADGGIAGAIERLNATQVKCEELRMNIQQRANEITRTAHDLSEFSIKDVNELLVYGPAMANALKAQERERLAVASSAVSA